ncbi:phage tail protein [Aquincola sp. J276]|uniref:phage tail protein n=1 Tax=Aquincola sp. J276 TaxID=2898432 RepID=UPI002150F86A|nr:phage tail protein [Aquincola sp. J276]MCR5864644.1 phage tail protein [Aquincola sp. J276]
MSKVVDTTLRIAGVVLSVAAIITGNGWVIAAAFAVNTASGISSARLARRQAVDAYNDSLKDRLQMTPVVDGARSRIYGRVRNVDGVLFKATHGAKSEFYTLVIAVADGECDAIEDVYFGDKKVTLSDPDAQGWQDVQSEPYNKVSTVSASVDCVLAGGVGTVTLPLVPLEGSVAAVYAEDGSQFQGAVSVAGSVVTVTAAVFNGAAVNGTYQVGYQWSESKSKARVRKWLGAPGQDLSGSLAERHPDLVNPADRFAGITLLEVELEYDTDVWPSGLLNISAVVRGVRVLDPRTGLVAWSENPALHAYDWARYPHGGDCPADVVPVADVIAAANACDVAHTFSKSDGSTVTAPMYTSGMACRLEGSPTAVMDELVEAMAGRWGWGGGLLRMRAGAYRAPVATITEDWLADTQATTIVPDPPVASSVNIVRATIANAAQDYVASQAPDVVAQAYVDLDGQELVRELTYSAVTDAVHAQHVSGVVLRDERSGLAATLPCNLRAFPLELFDTVLVDLPSFGWSAKAFEVLGWQFGLAGGVVLSVKETAPSIFDPDALFTREDATPNTSLPDPFFVPPVLDLAAESGTEQLLLQADGSIVSRVRVSWAPIDDEAVLNGGAVEIRYGQIVTDPATWPVVRVPGDATEVHLLGVKDGAIYSITARARNALVRGDWGRALGHRVLGKTAPPRNVPSIAAEITTDGVLISVPQNADLDRDVTELRVSGIDWESSVPLVGSQPTRFAGTTYLWPRPPAGIYRVRARYFDTSGNDSLADAYVDVTIGAAELIAWGAVSGRPRLFRVVTRGWNVDPVPTTPGDGLFDGETGVKLHGVSRSYAMARIRRSDGAVTYTNYYDVLAPNDNSWDNPGFGKGADVLAADLNATGSDHLVVVWSWDEPQSNRLIGGLPDAMYRCGASRAVFGSPEFGFRSAYILVGIPGCGEGNGSEAYQGNSPGQRDAWCDLSFQLLAGQLISNGGAYQPRTLRDFAYTGDLNATATLRLVARNGCETSGSVARKTADTGPWVGDVFSRDGYAGGAYAAAVADRTDRDLMFGLDRTPSETSGYYEIDAAIYLRSDGVFTVYQSGNPWGDFGTYAAGDRFMVLYDGTRLHYSRNGTVFFTFDWVHNDPLYFDSSFVQVGGSLSGIEFGPLSSIRRAVDAANTAQTAANNAAAAANSALADLAAIASDSVLSRSEKSRVIQDWNVLANEQAGVLSQADNYAVVAEKNAYMAALNDLAGYLSGLSPGWADTSQDSVINGATWRYVWQQAYLTRQAVLDKIAANAKARLGALATLSQVGTPQIIDYAATVPINVPIADGTHDPASNPSIPIFGAYTFDNTTGAQAVVEVIMTGTVYGFSVLAGSDLHVVSEAVQYDAAWNNTGLGRTLHGERIRTNTNDPSDQRNFAFSHPTYVLPPGGKLYVSLRSSRQASSITWFSCTMRLNAILK